MKNPLSPNEFKIMQLLWKEGRPLSRPEIIELIPDRDWNPNSIHLILNNMIEKGVIRVEGMTRCGRGYGRTYAATVDNLEYAVNLLKDATPETDPDERVLGVLKLLLADGVKPETVEELKSILAAR
ncbi:MAG: BlaI/MecI/CopY family transcriptional regulator [Oscillospiraceae bacterium]|nr:BlaI/MecI/CopY family transcriptional regulator [Oscillospiraceae bacterium]MBR4194423.1 BlaI/MecI/CopY family transcriptional regulator [Oscillospiraceae bacterium]MBR4655266.1 BlaI/MecI/CopY family transcriptional regulator [Oscillospiraceae bacterium]